MVGAFQSFICLGRPGRVRTSQIFLTNVELFGYSRTAHRSSVVRDVTGSTLGDNVATYIPDTRCGPGLGKACRETRYNGGALIKRNNTQAGPPMRVGSPGAHPSLRGPPPCTLYPSIPHTHTHTGGHLTYILVKAIDRLYVVCQAFNHNSVWFVLFVNNETEFALRQTPLSQLLVKNAV